MRKLKDIIPCQYDVEILGIADDSRSVEPGYLFVATKGYFVDHYDYISDAVHRGAVAVISDREVETSVPVILVSDINLLFPQLCQKFYDLSLTDFKLIGITGTDGKTTTSTLIRELVSPSLKTAYIGTNGMVVGEEHYVTGNTTPCISELFDDLCKIKQDDCQSVVMEVSSESLLHQRVSMLSFDVVGFTNITEDHLNIHGTLENYRNCKFELLDLLKEAGLVFYNGDDDNCRMIRHDNSYSFGFSSDNDYVISGVKNMSNFVKFNIQCQDAVYTITSPLLGLYNVYNVTLAFLISRSYGIDSNLLIKRIKDLKPVEGRRELLDFGQDFDIILDYAHTFNGIKSILDSVQAYSHIIVVTGAAGGREKEKRPQIGSYVLEHSDYVVFTMDDPRNEDVDKIIDDLVSSSQTQTYERVFDREKAIARAFDLATPNTVVLVLGKGRDAYMALGDERLPYCDYDSIEKYFNKK